MASEISGPCHSSSGGHFHLLNVYLMGQLACVSGPAFLCISFESSEPVLLPLRRQSTVAQRGHPTLGSSCADSQPPTREWRTRGPTACKHLIFPPNHRFDWALSWAQHHSPMTCHSGSFTIQPENVIIRHDF